MYLPAQQVLHCRFDAAVAALTDDEHIGQLYELTGPRLLTFAQAIAEIAKASGREIHYVKFRWISTSWHSNKCSCHRTSWR